MNPNLYCSKLFSQNIEKNTDIHMHNDAFCHAQTSSAN